MPAARPSARNDPTLHFGRVLDLRRADVHRRQHFAFAFTADGVSLHLNMERPPKGAAPAARAAVAPRLPKRGIHSIDALKAAARAAIDPLSGMHVVGIDPGKRELVVCVDADKPRRAPVVRYTLAQRRRDMRARQYADEGKRAKPAAVTDAEEQLSAFRSKAPSLTEYARFSTERRALLRARPEIADFYADLAFRERRRKSKIKAQQSEARLVKRIRGMHAADDPRQLVLAYGAWGRAAGRPNAPGNKGHPPAPGAGLMKRLARDFVVALTHARAPHVQDVRQVRRPVRRAPDAQDQDQQGDQGASRVPTRGVRPSAEPRSHGGHEHRRPVCAPRARPAAAAADERRGARVRTAAGGRRGRRRLRVQPRGCGAPTRLRAGHSLRRTRALDTSVSRRRDTGVPHPRFALVWTKGSLVGVLYRTQ